MQIHAVRVDYYSNGKILPLGMTLTNGKSIYFDTVLDVKKQHSRGNSNCIYTCVSGSNKIKLMFDGMNWHII